MCTVDVLNHLEWSEETTCGNKITLGRDKVATINEKWLLTRSWWEVCCVDQTTSQDKVARIYDKTRCLWKSCDRSFVVLIQHLLGKGQVYRNSDNRLDTKLWHEFCCADPISPRKGSRLPKSVTTACHKILTGVLLCWSNIS